MKDTEQAANSVAEVLYESDQDLYVYAPPGEHRFIGEAVIVGAAGVLLEAFFGGVKAAAQKRVEEWGKSITGWLFDQIQALFKDPQGKAVKGHADSAATEAEAAVRANPGGLAVKSTAQIEAAIAKALITHNIPEARAKLIARSVAKEGLAVLKEAP